MNALYDAPFEAGYFKKSVSRDQDVELPQDRACEISYGVERGQPFVRVRDPFGALSRERLLDVLDRCNDKEVRLDESRGGAGLGMWRVLTAASTVTITVVPRKVTDIVVTFPLKRVSALHLYLEDRRKDVELAESPDEESEDGFDRSVTLVVA
jgi:hypothetical protein